MKPPKKNCCGNGDKMFEYSDMVKLEKINADLVEALNLSYAKCNY